jgi:hypothetical protein
VRFIGILAYPKKGAFISNFNFMHHITKFSLIVEPIFPPKKYLIFLLEYLLEMHTIHTHYQPKIEYDGECIAFSIYFCF